MPLVLEKTKTILDVNKLREDFPILQKKVNGKDLIFLDNASTTQKPQVVVASLVNYYQTQNANIHRGVYQLSQQATQEYEKSREVVANFIGAKSTQEVIFTRNTTESINLIAYSWGRKNLKTGDQILLTEMEHHSNLVPWQQLAREKKLTINFLPIDAEGRLKLSNLKNLVTKKTKLVALTHASNVLGTINPIEEITQIVKKINPQVVVVVDGAQAVGHFPVAVGDLGVDFYCLSAHKMLGPTGVGVLWGKQEILEKMPPFLTGGDMVGEVTGKSASWNLLPWKFEAGTPNIADVVAFKEAINYLEKIGLANIQRAEEELTGYTLETLSQIKNLKIYGPKEATARIGVISFNLGNVHAHDVATILDYDGICIRSGHHCAQPLLTKLKTSSLARVSLYLYNIQEEIDKLALSLKKAAGVFTK